MRSAELLIQSFVIKIWLEETAVQNGTITWRGLITHVPGGDRRYFTTLAGMNEFIQPYLTKMSDDLPAKDAD